MARRRLLWQLYPIYLVLTLLSVLGVGGYAVRALREFHHGQRVEDLVARGRLIREMLRAELAGAKPDALDAFCKRVGQASGMRVTIIDGVGKVLGDSEEDPAEMDDHSGRPEIIEARETGRGSASRYSHTLGRNLAYIAIPAEHPGLQDGIIRVALPVDEAESALGRTIARVGGAGLAVALLAVALGLVAVWRLILPLEEMKRGADRFARGEFARKLAVPRSLEIGGLAESMNRMAAELDERIRTVVHQRNEHEALLASMVEGVLAVDREERVISLNAAAERLVGIRAAEAQGKSIQEAIRNTELQHLVARALGGESPAEAELTMRGDSLRHLQAHASALRDSRGVGIGAVIVLNDITRIRRLETLRTDFVANVSHELKTPITSIKGFVETLLENQEENTGETRRFLEIIARHADRLTSIIDDLLSLSKIEQEADRGGIELRPGPVAEVIDAAVQVCEAEAAGKRIALERRCEPGLSARINSALLEQAVINLIDNAIKYSPEGGKVEIEAAREGREVRISVTDHGIGIAQEHLSRLFERFYRVDKARSRKLGGTGLGLAIVKHIVQAHGGKVAVESRVGEGSRFSIRLRSAGDQEAAGGRG